MVHLADLSVERAYLKRDSETVAAVELGGGRTVLIVPMLKEDELIGIISHIPPGGAAVHRQANRVGHRTSPTQAVIAIENTRLLNELRESLQQQTATAEVLGVISSSPGELQPVFDAMLANAVRLCAASFGNLYLRDGEFFHLVAFHNTPPAFVAQRRGRPYRPSPIGPPGRMLRTRAVVHVDDLTADPSYRERDPGVVAFVELAGTRTVLLVPMLKDGEPIGYLSIYRQEVRPFADREIELLGGFAAQAVIAIENTRLLNELARRSAAAADRHRRRAQGHQPLDLRPAARARYVGRMRRDCVRPVRPHVALRRRRISHRGASWRAAGSEPMAKRSLVPWQSGSPIGPRRQDPSAGPCCRSSYDKGLPCRTINWRALVPTSRASAHWSPCRCSRRTN